MGRHIVCRTFDFDAVSSGITRGLTKFRLLSGGKFSPRISAPRVLALLEWQVLKTTWFTPGQILERFPAICGQVIAAGHEIGHHGWSHRSPIALSREEESELVRGNGVFLQRAT